MNVRTIANKVIQEKGGIAKASEFVEAGLCSYDVVNLCNSGYLERIRNGYYELAEENSVSEDQLISKLLPEGIICMESAFFHYGYSDFTPRKWSITVPRTVSRSKIPDDVLYMQTYYVQPSIYELGKTMDEFSGIVLPVYDRERTICDCFKYRSRLDSEIFNKTLHAYVKDEQKNLQNPFEYAKKMRVQNKLYELMEVLLNE